MMTSFLGQGGKTLPNSIQVTNDAVYEPGRWAVSITLMDPKMDSDQVCDSVSAYSFSVAMKMWNLQEHARFPEKNRYGTQLPGVYEYTCTEGAQSDIDALRAKIALIHTAKTAVEDFSKDLGAALQLGALGKKLHKVESKDELQIEFTTMQRDLSLALGKLPQPLSHALECTKDLVFSIEGKNENCPTSEVLLHEYYGTHGVVPRTVGSTDCDKGQITINDAMGDMSN